MPRVIFLTFERLAPAYLGCYGNDWIETPNLDRLAIGGVVFDEHFADVVNAEEAGESWWRALPGMNGSSPSTPLDDLWQQLRAAGVRTVCLAEVDETASSRKHPPCDEVREFRVEDGESLPEPLTPGFRFASFVADWLATNSLPENSLLWLRCRGVPEPWYPPADYQDLYFDEFGLADENDGVLKAGANHEDESDEDDDDEWEESDEPERDTATSINLPVRDLPAEVPDVGSEAVPGDDPDDDLQERLGRALYAACVTALDRVVGKLLSALETGGLLAESIVIVTAARGPALGEHAPLGTEPPRLHAELTHIPLIVRIPGAERDVAGTRRRELTQPEDVRQALIDWLGHGSGIAANTSSSTLSQLVAPDGPPTASTPRLHAIARDERLGWMIRSDSATFLCPLDIPAAPDDPAGRFYLLPDDRHEFADTLSQAPEEVRQHWDVLRQWAGAMGQAGGKNG